MEPLRMQVLQQQLDAISFTASFSSPSGELWRRLRLNVWEAKRPRSLRVVATDQNVDLPRPAPRHKKKPWITVPKRGGFLTKLRRGEPTLRNLPTPSNGLLVSGLIPVAHDVMHARSLLAQLVPQLIQIVPVKVCKFCGEVHVGPVGHGIATCNGPEAGKRRGRHVWTSAKVADVMPQLDVYHLYDRLKTVLHTERFTAVRIPAIVELCIQAGVDLPEYPALRRTRPVKAIGRKLVEEDVSLYEFDDDDEFAFLDTEKRVADGNNIECQHEETVTDGESSQEDEEEEVAKHSSLSIDLATISTSELAERTLETWMTMRNGVKRLMKKYIVKVCGYCPEVHVGPKGHKVKDCGAFKHQWRAGQHGWQKATIDDFIPPKYVWHVNDLLSPRLENELKRYYGKAPAIVELCVQAGAPVPSEFKPMMRVDVVVPDITEMYNAV